jgi:hypothetical protein
MENLEKLAKEGSVKISAPSNYAPKKEVAYEGLVLKQTETYATGGTGKLYWM